MSDILLIPPGKSVDLDPTSSAFAHGFGLFETMRYAEGRIYFWEDHWARLSDSARAFGLNCPAPDTVLGALRTYIRDAELTEATLKLSLLKEATGSRLYVYTRPPLPQPRSHRLLFDTTHPIFPRSVLSGHKTHNYMEAMHLLGQARGQAYYDLLRVDTEGYLAETTTSNFFFLKGARLHTPSLATGILPGVTRAALLRSLELPTEEGLYDPHILFQAEAVFVTNATGGLQAIEQIIDLPTGRQVDYPTDLPQFESIRAAFARICAERARPV